MTDFHVVKDMLISSKLPFTVISTNKAGEAVIIIKGKETKTGAYCRIKFDGNGKLSDIDAIPK